MIDDCYANRNDRAAHWYFIRNHVIIKINESDYYEYAYDYENKQRRGCQPEPEHAKKRKYTAEKFEHWIADWYGTLARCASSSEKEPAKNRYVLIPAELMLTDWTERPNRRWDAHVLTESGKNSPRLFSFVRTVPPIQAAQWNTVDAYTQKTSNYEAQNKHKNITLLKNLFHLTKRNVT